jgi:hypothetical protein
MDYRSLIVIVIALTSAQVVTADAQSVYVAPGGVYIGAGPVYVMPASPNGAQPYLAPGPIAAPVVVAPGPGYEQQTLFTNGGYVTNGGFVTNGGYAAPAYEPPVVSAYGAYVSPRREYVPPATVYGRNGGVYGAQSPHVMRERAYVRSRVYAADEIVPRPSAVVPYYSNNRCVINGRRQYCN